MRLPNPLIVKKQKDDFHALQFALILDLFHALFQRFLQLIIQGHLIGRFSMGTLLGQVLKGSTYQVSLKVSSLN